SEVADALSPYVAGASQSMARLRQTGLWQAPVQRHKLRWALAWLGGAAAAALLLGLLVVAAPNLFRRRGGTTGWGNDADANPRAPPPQVVTVENGLTVAKDGTGQFTTITAALAAVTPGMTVRVLDNATYSEALNLNLPSRYAGLTLEAVNGATLAPANVAGGVAKVAPAPA